MKYTGRNRAVSRFIGTGDKFDDPGFCLACGEDECVCDKEDLRIARAELKRVQSVAAKQVIKNASEIAKIRKEYRDWLYHLARLGMDGKQRDVVMYTRRIANRLKGSETASALHELLTERGIKGSPLRNEQEPVP